MPKATAVWLIENTSLTFEQIGDFCGLHSLEVQGIADEDVAKGIAPVNPIVANQLTKEEIARCEANPNARLLLSNEAELHIRNEAKKKSKKYTPVARRQDKPDAVLWFLKNHPEVSDSQIARLLGTTKSTIESILNKSHWNYPNMTPKDPVLLGLCSQSELDHVLEVAAKKAEQLMLRQKNEISEILDQKLLDGTTTEN